MKLKWLLVGTVALVATAGILWWQKPRQLSYYNEKLDWVVPEERPIPELEFLVDTLRLVEANGVIPTDLKAYDAATISGWSNQLWTRLSDKQIPTELRELYVSKKAVKEVKQLLPKVRQEYLDYAKGKLISKQYLDEIDRKTLPDKTGRLNYVVGDGLAEINTNTHTYDKLTKYDYSQLQIDVYPENIYQQAKLLQTSKVLGEGNELEYRNMALRYVMFHEMTHVLQQAVDVVNANSSRGVLAIDPQYYQLWGKETDQLTRDINNTMIAKESQAEGIAIQMLTDIYQLAPIQQQLVWEHHFGGLETGKAEVEEAFRIMEQINPNISLELVIQRMRMLLPAEATLTLLLDRLEGMMAAHVGYLHPMQPTDTHLFWEYLEK